MARYQITISARDWSTFRDLIAQPPTSVLKNLKNSKFVASEPTLNMDSCRGGTRHLSPPRIADKAESSEQQSLSLSLSSEQSLPQFSKKKKGKIIKKKIKVIKSFSFSVFLSLSFSLFFVSADFFSFCLFGLSLSDLIEFTHYSINLASEFFWVLSFLLALIVFVRQGANLCSLLDGLLF